MINLTPDNKLKPAKGRVLLSYPIMNDPFFKRTVILLCEHNEEGSFGFVLNKYLDIELSDLVEDFPEVPGKIGMGGPVQTSNLYYLHTLGDIVSESMEVIPGLYMGGDFEGLQRAVKNKTIQEGSVRFFVGYSGWSANQLEDELSENSWLITKASAKVLMNTNDDNLWINILKGMGSKYAVLVNMPEDPSLN